jgi:SAM-dependent methyltransferase
LRKLLPTALKAYVDGLSAAARAKRARIFRDRFRLSTNTKILDIGSEDGTHINRLLKDTPVLPENVTIADIDQGALDRGSLRFGYDTILLDESEDLPFEDKSFDIVYCSSVIEHVTIPKEEVWGCTSQKDFESRSWLRQKMFANEIARVGKQYFIQTPNKWFIIESHTWLPFLGYLPRPTLMKIINVSNAVWIMAAVPDFNLLDGTAMGQLFPDSEIVFERHFRMVKSIMAIKDANPESDRGLGSSVA